MLMHDMRVYFCAVLERMQVYFLHVKRGSCTVFARCFICRLARRWWLCNVDLLFLRRHEKNCKKCSERCNLEVENSFNIGACSDCLV